MSNGMKHLIILTAATATVMGAVGCGVTPNSAGTALKGAGVRAESVTGEVIVKFKNASARQGVLQKMGLRTVNRIEKVDAVVVKSPDAAKTIAALKADPNVAYAEPNYIAKAFDLPSQAPNFGFIAGRGDTPKPDELLAQCWGMTKIGAAAAWAVTPGTANVTVAVVDTGVDYTHPDFSGRVAKGRDFINNDDDAMDDHYHGTHCAGTVGAGINNGGVVGVAPGVSILAVKVLSGSGSGSYAGVANGIIYAADQGAPVISMSLGGSSSSAAVDDAVKYAISKGSLVVAAMGNNGSEGPSYPAASAGVMAVGSTTVEDKRSSFSNFGKHISVGAPGSDVYSTVPGGKYKSLSGTSMATPHTAGLAGLVKSRFPEYTAAQIRTAIEGAADDLGDAGFDKYFGAGRINAAKAIPPVPPAGR